MKKGYTLVELVVVVAIVIIVLNISFLSIKGLNNFKSYGDMEYAVDSVVQFINGAKSLARSEEESVFVRLLNDNTLGLYLHTKEMKTLILPKGIIISNITASRGYIEFNMFGSTGDACTISILSNTGNIRAITIKVGTAYVSEKE
jgi:prepilin-type N-terminal cleavage/methylation domain-containing protein